MLGWVPDLALEVDVGDFWLTLPSRPSMSGFTGRTGWGVVKPLPGSGTVAHPVKLVVKRIRAVIEKNDRNMMKSTLK